jgi:hypothetical protein
VAFEEEVAGVDPRLEIPSAVIKGAEPCLRLGSEVSSVEVEVDCCDDGNTGMAEGRLNNPPPDISAELTYRLVN